jgi:hypothetical protein
MSKKVDIKEILSDFFMLMDSNSTEPNVQDKLTSGGASDETICVIACCLQMLEKSRPLVRTLNHLSDHHHVITAGELAISILKEMKSAMTFVHSMEAKYDVKLVEAGLADKLKKVLVDYEEDLDGVKAARVTEPPRLNEYEEDQ